MVSTKCKVMIHKLYLHTYSMCHLCAISKTTFQPSGQPSLPIQALFTVHEISFEHYRTEIDGIELNLRALYKCLYNLFSKDQCFFHKLISWARGYCSFSEEFETRFQMLLFLGNWKLGGGYISCCKYSWYHPPERNLTRHMIFLNSLSRNRHVHGNFILIPFT